MKPESTKEKRLQIHPCSDIHVDLISKLLMHRYKELPLESSKFLYKDYDLMQKEKPQSKEETDNISAQSRNQKGGKEETIKNTVDQKACHLCILKPIRKHFTYKKGTAQTYQRWIKHLKQIQKSAIYNKRQGLGL